MIAGPNGAGKTTMALELFADQRRFYEWVNADEIARGLAPLHPESVALAASKLMIKRMRDLLEMQKSFAFETTGSGTNYVKHLNTAKAMGYEINLLFLWLKSPQQAIKRVMQRIQQGGHHVPKETIMRRYYSGLKNLVKHYLPLADTAVIIDNSSADHEKRAIAKKQNGRFTSMDEVVWKQIEGLANEG